MLLASPEPAERIGHGISSALSKMTVNNHLGILSVSIEALRGQRLGFAISDFRKGVSTLSDLARTQTPEELELERYRRELDSLENELAEKELTRATLEADLGAFEAVYIRRVGTKYAELDELLAQIAEAQAASNQDDPTKRESAQAARKQAEETIEAVGQVDLDQPVTPFEPSDSMKQLFRSLVKRFHPDKGKTPEQRKRYAEIFKAINDAYRSGDENRLRKLARELEASPDEIDGDSIAEQLVRAIRMIAQIRLRTRSVVAAIEELKLSEIYLLREQVNTATAEGRDLLGEMAIAVQEEIDAANHLAKSQSP